MPSGERMAAPDCNSDILRDRLHLTESDSKRSFKCRLTSAYAGLKDPRREGQSGQAGIFRGTPGAPKSLILSSGRRCVDRRPVNIRRSVLYKFSASTIFPDLRFSLALGPDQSSSPPSIAMQLLGKRVAAIFVKRSGPHGCRYRKTHVPVFQALH